MSEGVQVIVDERQLLADLEVLKSSESRNVVVSETFDYLLVVSNSGQDEATSVFVTDILPVELGFEKLDGPQLGSANYETENRKVQWKNDKLDVGASDSLKIPVTALTDGGWENRRTERRS